MKQDKDWIDAMRSSLRDAEPAPPAGGWERLERELGAVKSPKPAWRIYWPRIAAAAAVLLCVVAGDILLRSDRGVMTDGNVIIPVADGGGNAADNPFLQKTDAASALAAQIEEPIHPSAERSTVGLIRGEAFAESVAGPMAGDLLPAGGDPATETTATSADAAAESGARATSAPHANKPKAGYSPKTGSSEPRAVPGHNLRQAYGDDLFAESTPRRNKTSVGLFAGGGMIGGSESAPRNSVFADALSPGNGQVIGSQRFNYSDYSFRHHLPLGVGLAVRKDLSHGLSLETGVNYTLLRSDVKVQYGSKDITQKLHFIGVPLRFNWRYFERNRFSLYVGAGGMLEKCVSAKFGSRSVEEDKLQWSAFASVGAQYRLGGVVALYFEPEASYYFTETTLRTSRTDSSVDFALRLGLRLSF